MKEERCYCPDCAGSWPEKREGVEVIVLCSCPCHDENEEDGAGEWIDDADYSEPFGDDDGDES